jgi:dolichol-phosphate mannosyltransferase
MPKRILIIIPTYNEAKNIRLLLKQIFPLEEELSVLIVDDNSPDGTSSLVQQLQAQYPRLFLITRPEKRGLAGAYKHGFDYALEQGYDIVIQMDADLSHSPQAIPIMIGLLDKYDMVIASRYVKGGGVADWSLNRKLLSRCANMFSKFMLRSKINDLTSGFKGIKQAVLGKINYSSIPSEGYAFQIELAFRGERAGFLIIEHPIIFQGRAHDQSKMSKQIVVEAFRRVLVLHYQ